MSTSILFIHGISAIGGAERELLVFLERLARLGYRVILVCPETGALVKEAHGRGIDTRSVPFVSWRKVFDYPRRFSAIRRLREVIACESPSLIHVNDIWWVPQTLRANKGTSIPLLAHVRQKIEPDKVPLYELHRVDGVFAVSNQIKESLLEAGVSDAHVRTIHSGVDVLAVPSSAAGMTVRAELGISENAPVLGTVANLFARKGYEVMLEALPKLAKLFPEIQYLVIGQGDPVCEARLHELVRTHKLQRHVHFLGFRSPIYPYLAAMDVYVQPALIEGLPIAVIEAMATGKPVVASRTGGIPELVLEGTTGYLVSPGSADELAQAVKSMLRDPALCSHMGSAGRARVESHFTVGSMMEQLTAAYRAIVDRSAAALARAPHG